MVFKNKNAFTLALSLIIVSTSLLEASESEESLLSKKSEIIRSNQLESIVIPEKALSLLGLEPLYNITEVLEILKKEPKKTNTSEENQSGPASQAAAPMKEPRTTEEDDE